METEFEPGLKRLREVMRGLGSAIVTLSGGVDSALVARIAHDELGEQAVALTAVSPTLPAEEAEVARQLVEEIGLRHVIIDSQELASEGYAANRGDRCFFCKSELFDLAEQQRQALGLQWVVDGTLLDDLGDDRPGLRAAAAHRVRHPLVEAGLSKSAVRGIAKSLGLSVWDKPSFACLGSRFPAFTRVTADKVTRVAIVESALRRLGIRQFRVRWHEIGDDVLARIEVEPDDITRLASPALRDVLNSACRQAGFRWVTLDLMGYRSPTNP